MDIGEKITLPTGEVKKVGHGWGRLSAGEGKSGDGQMRQKENLSTDRGRKSSGLCGRMELSFGLVLFWGNFSCNVGAEQQTLAAT